MAFFEMGLISFQSSGLLTVEQRNVCVQNLRTKQAQKCQQIFIQR